uniref:Calponin-homology (CH) domain-containing protein n=1 Tax=Zonotrichia albicollis TaxID=44394 RepID=A0A8D2Q9L1_ZONAL
VGFRGAGGERLTADEMDEQRRQNVAYQYLCHLEEAKRWMEACLGEELPPPTELEETLRNGVLLAKLGHCFAPAVVPLKKIYDPEQTRYKTAGLHFRHTDNINHWRDAMSHVGLPSIFHPETTDIYDKKNMPRVVYCIHALSFYLFKLGLAPLIQDLYGKVNFTEEEINNMKRELEKYGLQLPAFSKIGGILANELSVDEAAVHAAVLAINEAVERGVVAQTMEALQNPHAMLVGLRQELAGAYQEVLHQAKLEKGSSARNRVREDVYDWCLTQAEIQGNINKVNVRGALEEVDNALERQDVLALHCALQEPSLALRCIKRDNLELYLEQLSTDREEKALELGYLELLEQEEVQAGILTANRRDEKERAMLQAVGRINAAVRQGMPAKTLEALLDPAAQLPDVHSPAAPLYQQQLALLQSQHPRGELTQEELFVAVEMLSAVALVNQALDARNPSRLWSSLVSPALGLSGVEDANAQQYFDDLLQLKVQSRKAGAEFLSWNDIQDSINNTNSAVQDENDRECCPHRVWARRGWQISWEGGCIVIPALVSHTNQGQLLAAPRSPGRDQLLLLSGFTARTPEVLQGAVRGLFLSQWLLWVLLSFPHAVLFSFFIHSDLTQVFSCAQACWRGYRQRRAYLDRLHYLKSNTEAAVKIQAAVRMWQTRRKYQERLRYFRQNWGKLFMALLGIAAVHTKSPPLSIVRRFIHLLEQSQHDFWEESEVLRLQEEVVKRIRASRQLESDLDLMDIKIGLLVKNRITLQEVVSHCKKLTKKNKEQLSEMMSMDKQKGLKTLSKEKRQKLEAYQHLFYLLQTQPVYLARLIFQMPQNKSTKFMESVIFTLYNYASSPREAYLLLQLFKVALQEEIRWVSCCGKGRRRSGGCPGCAEGATSPGPSATPALLLLPPHSLAHLCGLNQYLEHTHSKFRRFISAACCVPEPEERFDMDEYSEMVAVAKPVIYITVGELINTHKLLLEHQDSITSHPSDPLHELLEDLDELPTVQSLLGSSAEQLSQLSRTEISLTLTNKLVPVASSEESDTRSLLLSTKQMLVDLIQCQAGDSLPDILWTPASEHEEAAHEHLVCQRALWDAQPSAQQLKHHPCLAANSQLSMEEKKRKVIRNLRRLESLGLVHSASHYQELIDELAKDIRNQRRHRQQRRRELLKLRHTLEGLDAKTLFYEEQIDYYNQYIKTCLDNLAKNVISFGSEWLCLLRLKNVVFDIIPCEESGKFQVKAKFMGIDMEDFQLHYQDLLQLQYEGVAVMKMFHKAKVNVNLLIFLLNKKFFKK